MQAAKGVPRKLFLLVMHSAYAPSLTQMAILGMLRRAQKYLIRTIFFYPPSNKVMGFNMFGLSQAFPLTKNSPLGS